MCLDNNDVFPGLDLRTRVNASIVTAYSMLCQTHLIAPRRRQEEAAKWREPKTRPFGPAARGKANGV